MAFLIREYGQAEVLITELSKLIADRLSQAVEQHGRASMAVSGGTSPIPLFRALSRIDLPWHRVLISLVDERWVDEDHPDSNAAMVRRELLQNHAAAASFLAMKTPAHDAFEAQPELNEQLEANILPLDIVILGMGDDGHTASLFPDAEGLAEALNTQTPVVCRGISVVGMPYTRMTLTLRTILSARHCILHITGEAKKATLAQALQDGSEFKMPVRAVLKSEKLTTEIYYSP